MKVNLLNLNYNNFGFNRKISQNSSLSFKGYLRSFDEFIPTAELKRISQKDYEEEIERRKKGETRIVMVDSSGDFPIITTYENEFSTHKDNSQGKNLDLSKEYEKPHKEKARELLTFEQKIERIKKTKTYDESYVNEEIYETLSNMDIEVINSLSDDFLCSLLQFYSSEAEIIDDFEAILETEFRPEELEIITNNPAGMDTLLFILSNAPTPEQYASATTVLHEMARRGQL